MRCKISYSTFLRNNFSFTFLYNRFPTITGCEKLDKNVLNFFNNNNVALSSYSPRIQLSLLFNNHFKISTSSFEGITTSEYIVGNPKVKFKIFSRVCIFLAFFKFIIIILKNIIIKVNNHICFCHYLFIIKNKNERKIAYIYN